MRERMKQVKVYSLVGLATVACILSRDPRIVTTALVVNAILWFGCLAIAWSDIAHIRRNRRRNVDTLAR